MKQKILSDPQGALLSMGVDDKHLLETLPSLLKSGDPKQALRSILHPKTSSERKEMESEMEGVKKGGEEGDEGSDGEEEEEEEAPPSFFPSPPPSPPP